MKNPILCGRHKWMGPYASINVTKTNDGLNSSKK